MRCNIFFVLICVYGAVASAAPPTSPVWTDVHDPTLPIDYRLQGEFISVDNDRIAAQVIALGNDAFQAVVYAGGLPGAGWDGSPKSLLDGRLTEDIVKFKAATAPKMYIAKPPEQFSAIQDFASPARDSWTGTLQGESFNLTSADGSKIHLQKTYRESPTMGAKPPAGAITLFDGKDTDAFVGGRVDDDSKTLHTDMKDIRTKQKFNSYTLHLEFLLPFRPEARGQKRANSGVYQVDHYEIQVLDSFGLEGLDNECGGLYKIAGPRVNMCYPPLSWQTYDIDFTNAVSNDAGEQSSPAVLTLRHNGVLIHENRELEMPTAGGRRESAGTPGALRFQGHGNPLQYRKIWIIEK